MEQRFTAFENRRLKLPSYNQSPTGTGPLVFIVDDEPMVLDLTRLALEPHGYRLKTFRNPVLALEAFRTAEPKPDLLLTDYAMTGMNGIDLMEACRKVRPGQKVLMMSGTVGTEVCGEGDRNPDRFVPKPFDIQEFAEMVGELTRPA